MPDKLCPFRLEGYGIATKPTTTSTLNNYELMPGTHDTTFSYVNFTGYTGTGISAAVLKMMMNPASGYDLDTYNITFDHCVFSTPTGIAANGVHFWNFSATGKTFHHITFDHCWFEPMPRMTVEMNGRGGWFHDITINRCTFEPAVGQMVSFDMSPDGNDPSSPYGVTVDGTVRGVENVFVTNNDLRGTGATVSGYGPSTTMGVEFRSTFPYSVDGSGKCSFTGNRLGATSSSWLNLNPYYCNGVTFANNLFDMTYNTHAIAITHDSPMSGSAAPINCFFTNNTWLFDSGTNHPWTFIGPSAGSANTFSGEHFTKTGSIGSTCSMPFTTSTYTNCHFHLPKAVTFAVDAVGTGCVFDNGYVNGTFT